MNTTLGEMRHVDGCVVLFGHDRQYVIGDTAYRYRRWKEGMTMPLACLLWPVVWIDGKWENSCINQWGRTKNWDQKVTVLEN